MDVRIIKVDFLFHKDMIIMLIFKIEKKKNSLLALPEKADSRKKKVKENERRANKCSFKETK